LVFKLGQPDLARAGGFTQCRRIAEVAVANHVWCVPHAWKSGILVAATLHFAATLAEATSGNVTQKVALPLNAMTLIFRADRYLSTDPSAPQPTYMDLTDQADTFRAQLQLQALSDYLSIPSGGATKGQPEVFFAFPFKLTAELGAGDDQLLVNTGSFQVLSDFRMYVKGGGGNDVVLFPNSPNVVMAAERAAELSDRHVCVVPSRSLQAGLAAAVSLDPKRRADENAAAMIRTLEGLRTGAVAPAARDDGQGRFRTGEAVGFVQDEIVAWGDPRETLQTVLAQLADGAELITCLHGVDAPLDEEAVAALLAGEVELEQSDGGQPSYWWLLSAE